MKLQQLFEKDNRVPHPFGERTSDIEDVMDEFWDIEGDLCDKLFPSSKYPDMAPSDKMRQTTLYMIKQGSAMDVKISDLNHIEPDVDPVTVSHYQQNPSDKLPVVYKFNGKLYINDGNHRVVAAHNNGDQTVKVTVVDLNAIRV